MLVVAVASSHPQVTWQDSFDKKQVNKKWEKDIQMMEMGTTDGVMVIEVD